MLPNIPENSLILEIILLSIIFFGFSVCLFIVRSKILTFKREKAVEDVDKNAEKSSVNLK